MLLMIPADGEYLLPRSCPFSLRLASGVGDNAFCLITGARRREKGQDRGSKYSPSAGIMRSKAATRQQQQQQQQQQETTAADAVAGRISMAETKGRTTKQAAQQREQEIATERAHQMEVKRRRAVREKNARIRNIRSFDLMAESVELEPSQEPERHSKKEGKDGKEAGAKARSSAYARATTAPASSSSSSSSESVTSLGTASDPVPRGESAPPPPSGGK